jgi:hypothetical protein
MDTQRDEDQQAGLWLAGQAHRVGYARGWELGYQVMRRLGRRPGFPDLPRLRSPWQDTISSERTGWRERAANLHGEPVFAMDYLLCRRCALGWVEQPFTEPRYQRCGLATAALVQLRAEHPGLRWHTAGGHMIEAREFWDAVGVGVAGKYLQHPPCPHVKTA